MAAITKVLELKDKFTSVFDRFIAKTEKANSSMDGVQEKADKMADVIDKATGATYRWADALDIFNTAAGADAQKAALLATQSYEELVNAGYLIQLSAGEAQEAIEDLDEEFEEEEEAVEKVTKKLDEMEDTFSRLFNISGPKKLESVFRRVGVQLFGLRKIVSLVKQSFERAPDDIAKHWQDLKQNALDTVARFAVSMLNGMTQGMDRLNAAFSSPAGERLIKFLQVGFEGLGRLVGFAAERVAEFMEFLGDQITNMGDSFADIFEFIGGGVGAIYVTIHNIVATLYNVIASFAEFIANVFNNPMDALISLWQGAFNFIMDCITTVSRAIDWIFGKNFTESINGFRNRINNWIDETQYSDSRVKLDRMEQIDYEGYVSQFAAAGRSFGERLSSASLENTQLQAIKNIESNTSAIKNAVTDEDLKMLVDMATQRFVSNVNLTSQTPVITVNGSNTGNTDADRKAIARAIQDILEQLLASGSTTGYYSYAEA